MFARCETEKFYKACRKKYDAYDTKCWQITQKTHPFAKNGFIDIGDKKVFLDNIAIEEDAAKTIGNNVDFNRAGSALIEITTKPCISRIEHVIQYLKKLRNILETLRIIDPLLSNAIRCDVNISIRDQNTIFPRTEIKNLNKISNIKKALKYEIDLQIQQANNNTFEKYNKTKKWSENDQKTIITRIKQDNSYCFLNASNLPTIRIDHMRNKKKAIYDFAVFYNKMSAAQSQNLFDLTIELFEYLRGIKKTAIYDTFKSFFQLIDANLSLPPEKYTQTVIKICELSVELCKQNAENFSKLLQNLLRKQTQTISNIKSAKHLIENKRIYSHNQKQLWKAIIRNRPTDHLVKKSITQNQIKNKMIKKIKRRIELYNKIDWKLIKQQTVKQLQNENYQIRFETITEVIKKLQTSKFQKT